MRKSAKSSDISDITHYNSDAVYWQACLKQPEGWKSKCTSKILESYVIQVQQNGPSIYTVQSDTKFQAHQSLSFGFALFCPQQMHTRLWFESICRSDKTRLTPTRHELLVSPTTCISLNIKEFTLQSFLSIVRNLLKWHNMNNNSSHGKEYV